MTDSQLFGKRLKAARKASGMKQGSLAKALGVDPKHISRLESGKVKPSFDLICEASRTLKISASLLFDLDIAEERPSILKERIYRRLQGAEIGKLQMVYRVLKAILDP